MRALYVGWNSVPIALRILASDLLPDCSIVNRCRFRVIRSTDAVGYTGTIVDGSISSATPESYLASFVPCPDDAAETTARVDSLRLFVDSSVNGGATWIPTETPVKVKVENP